MARLAPFVVGEPTYYESGSGTGWVTTYNVPTVPGGIKANDVFLVAQRNQSSTAVNDFANAAFTRLGPAFVASSTSFRIVGFYAHRVTAAEIALGAIPSSYTFTAGTSGAGRNAGTFVVVRGVDPDTYLAGYNNSYGGESASAGALQRALAFAISGACLQLTLASNECTDRAVNPTTAPAGHTLIRNTYGSNASGTQTAIWLGSRPFIEAGNTSDADVAWSSTNARAIESIALLGAEEPLEPEPPEGYGLELPDGRRLYIQTDEGIRTPVGLHVAKRGFSNVTEMLAKPGVTWAHRGGGMRFAEMSPHAYTMAVLLGYSVLEISVQRTLDGYWIGCHDANLSATSLGASSAPINTMTLAQVMAVENAKCQDGRPQQYALLEDLIRLYKDTHILVLDIKESYGNATYRNEFYEYCQWVGAERCIIKFYYSGTAVAIWANDNGFYSWGYIYDYNMNPADAAVPSRYDSTFMTKMNYWSIWGLNISADKAAYWDYLNEPVRKGSRKLFGHIAQSQADYDTAILKGADGVQCSATHLITAVGA